MGTTSTNTGFYKPTIGETGWGALVDTNFDTIDDDNVSTTLYVRPTGSNSSSGRNWMSAKKDVLGAWDALPSNGGVIIFESGSYIDSTNTDRGLWIGGPNDASYASLPTGWRQQKSLHLVGVPTLTTGTVERKPAATLFGGSASDTTKPCLWVTGTNTPMAFENISWNGADAAQPILLGKSASSSTATNTANLRFDNCRMRTHQTAGLGPTVDIYGAYWVWFEQCSISSNEQEAATADKRANVLIRGNAIGEGLYTIRDCQFNGGAGVKQNAGTSVNILIEATTQEGATTGGAGGAPVYWLNGVLGSGGGHAYIRYCESSDRSTGASEAVTVSPGNSPERVIIQGVPDWSGPVLNLGTYPNVASARTATLLQDGGFGFLDGRVYAQQDSNRRNFGFALVRYANKASDDVTAWGALSGGATVTTGQTGPDGLTNAAKLSSGSFAERKVVNVGQTVAVGDWIIGGVWMKVDSTTNGPPTSTLAVGTVNVGNLVNNGVSNVATNAPPFQKEQSWQWVHAAAKLTTVGTAGSILSMALRSDSGKAMYYYGPVCWYIPTGTLSDGEVWELVTHLSQYSNTASAQQVALMRDINMHIPKGYIELGEMTAPSAGATDFGRLYMEDNGSGKTRLVVKFATGAAQVIATQP